MRYLFVLFFLTSIFTKGQIVVDNNIPYNDPTSLVDNILLGGGIIASNHTFQGATAQIGWFNAQNTSLGLDSGIILSTGDIYSIDPLNIGLGVTMPVPGITDPDLLTVANSVPPLIGQTFTVGSVNDVAILEFDFVPTSDSISFRYVFGSEEYFAYENTQFNDVFGFFLSGPGINGPYANGAINLAIVPNSSPELPVTISSVNNGNNGTFPPINDQYFIDNSLSLDTIASADGLTTIFIAKALVQCNETYHIRLAIGDGTDGLLDSYVWLEAGSFSSPILDVVNDLGIDSTILDIPCNASITLSANGGVGASYQWFDSNNVVIATDSFVTIGPGTYWVEASSFGCPVVSDTFNVIGDVPPQFDLGTDYLIPCNTFTYLNPTILGNLNSEQYQYFWKDLVIDSLISQDSIISVSQGQYSLQVYDTSGCYHLDTISIIEDPNPIANINGGGSICDDGNTVKVSFNFNGLLPWDLYYSNEQETFVIENIFTSQVEVDISESGEYRIDSAIDLNGCLANPSEPTVTVNFFDMPQATIYDYDSIIYIGDITTLSVGDFKFYEWYQIGSDNVISQESSLVVSDSGNYYVWVEDYNGCEDISDTVRVNTVPLTHIYVPNSFTPNSDEHNELFVIKVLNILSYKLQIFNRFGTQVYLSNDVEKHWNGYYKNNKVPEGIYTYLIEVVGEDYQIYNRYGSINVIY